jgi:hypothetical protein
VLVTLHFRSNNRRAPTVPRLRPISTTERNNEDVLPNWADVRHGHGSVGAEPDHVS